MSKAQTCPICLGKGKLIDEKYYSSTGKIDKTCHGCHGRGWVEVND